MQTAILNILLHNSQHLLLLNIWTVTHSAPFRFPNMTTYQINTVSGRVGARGSRKGGARQTEWQALLFVQDRFQNCE